MIRPDLSEDALLRRHQNPLGFALRGVALLLLVVGLFAHRPGLILLALLIEGATWLLLPGHDSPPEWVEQILDMEFAFLDLPPSGLKIGLGVAFGFGFSLFALGLWAHHFATVLFGLLLIAAVLGVLRLIATR